jgi:hypothetical protein
MEGTLKGYDATEIMTLAHRLHLRMQTPTRMVEDVYKCWVWSARRRSSYEFSAESCEEMTSQRNFDLL